MTVRPLAALTLPALLLCCSSTSSAPTGDPTDPSELSAPATGQGFQFGTPVFSIPAGIEEQDCYFFKVSDLAQSGGLDPTLPVELHRVQVVQKAGSHHMNIFRVRTIVGLDPANGLVQKAQNGTGQCFKSSNWADWPLVANTQINGNLDWTYPDGVVNELDPDEMLMLQTHYVNAETQTTPDSVGQVLVNFTVLPAADVKAADGDAVRDRPIDPASASRTRRRASRRGASGTARCRSRSSARTDTFIRAARSSTCSRGTGSRRPSPTLRHAFTNRSRGPIRSCSIRPISR